MKKLSRLVLSGSIAAFLCCAATGEARAHNLLLVAGSPQIVIFKLSSGDVVVTKVLASDDAASLNGIAPAAGK